MDNGYAICFNEWALDKDIKNELGLLLIISSLCAEKGYCFATNNYFSKLFDIPEQTVSRKLKILLDKNYIIIEYKKKGCEIIERNIRLTKMLIHDYQKCESTINKNVKDNNTILNNIKENTNNKLLVLKKNFKKPTLDEVKEYCKERNNTINAQQFIDYYESNGWKVGRNTMKDWKACVRTWESRTQQKTLTAREKRDLEFQELLKKYGEE